MSCVRKRGTKWTAQVRVSGWRSFTKTFAKKSDAVLWSNELETRLRAAPLILLVYAFQAHLSKLCA
tara:strand:- start:826 stop:1023 length:198 start_codon:yes stop_codon:yes gene_type:complete